MSMSPPDEQTAPAGSAGYLRPWSAADRATAAAVVGLRVSEHDRFVVPRIRGLRALGLSWRAAARALEAAGVPPPRHRWTHVAVRRIALRHGIE